MFAVDDIRAVVARLEARGAALVSEIARRQDAYLFCYVLGPEGIIIGLAQQLA